MCQTANKLLVEMLLVRIAQTCRLRPLYAPRTVDVEVRRRQPVDELIGRDESVAVGVQLIEGLLQVRVPVGFL